MPGCARRAVAAALAGLACVAASGCGGSDKPDAQSVLKDTFTGHHKVDSGRAAVAVRFGSLVDVRIAGPFERGTGGQAPKVALKLSGQIPGQTIDASLTTTGTQLFFGQKGKQFLAPDTAFRQLQQGYAQGVRQGSNKGLLDRLGVALRWLHDPKLAPDTSLQGVPVRHVTAQVDVRALLDDLVRLSARAKNLNLPTGKIPTVTPQDASALLGSVRSSGVDVFSGRDDKTLRRMVIVLHLGSKPGQTGTAGAATTDVTLSVDLSDLNRPQTIAAPSGAKPLPGGAATPSPGAAPPTPQELRYQRCIQDAHGDVARAQKCTGLLKG